jgi:hypothetical protein
MGQSCFRRGERLSLAAPLLRRRIGLEYQHANLHPRPASRPRRGLCDTPGTLGDIVTTYTSFPYKTLPGRKYARHGFLRRFNVTHHCIERVFEMPSP